MKGKTTPDAQLSEHSDPDQPIEASCSHGLTPDSRLRYSLNEAAHLLGISLRQLQYRIEAGEIRVVRDGNKPLIAREELKRYASVSHGSLRRKSK